MRKGFIILVVLLLATLLAHFLVEQRGLFLLRWGDYQIKTSLPIFLLLLLLAYGGIRLMMALVYAPRNMQRAVGHYRAQRSDKKISQGLTHLFSGNWKQGERLLSQNAKESSQPALGYLGAAKAAHMQGKETKRDQWMQQAQRLAEDHTHAVEYTQAELHISEQQYSAARDILQRLHQARPTDRSALVLLAKTYMAMDDASGLSHILLPLKKRKAVSTEQWLEYARCVWLWRFSDFSALEQTDQTIKKAWRQVPKPLQKEADLVSAYANALAHVLGADAAERFVRQQLNKQWQSSLAYVYGYLPATHADTQLQFLEKQIGLHQEDANLHYALAALCVTNELWGKAQSYLSQALALSPKPAGFKQQGDLLTRLGDKAAASEAYANGLALCLATEQSTVNG